VHYITLNSPKNHNALDTGLIQELTDAFKGLQQRKDVRVVVLKGSGKSFCAGANLEFMRDLGKGEPEANLKDAQKLYEMFRLGSTLPMPVIGQIHGNVYGGGLGLVSICDIVAAETKTKLCFSEVKLGLVPAVISSFCMRKMPTHQARYWMMTAGIFTAEQAQQMGLAHFVGDESSVSEYVQNTLQQILENGPESIRAIKALLDFVELNSHDTFKLRDRTTTTIAQLRASIEGQEGMTAFLEKRKPSWRL
jgi:methylglutaconyl-CoA hydratase